MPPIIDFHIHVGRSEMWKPWVFEWAVNNLNEDDRRLGAEHYLDSIAASWETLEKHLDECGVDYAVILAEESPITTGITPNDYVINFCRGSKRLIPFCSVNHYLHATPGKELERLITQDGFRGLKIYPTYEHFYANDRELYPMYAVLQDAKLPLMVHTGSSVFKGAKLKYGDPLALDDVAVDFPDLNIVMAHSGRGFWYDRAFFLARLHEHVYMELAGLPPTRLLEYFPEFERNADKIIFGTDWPGMPYIKRNIEQIRKLPLKASTFEKILGGNAARVLGLGG
ncbi:MAG: amidohydrolase [Chloroflexi bacterium]|nr:amidohydrolase [Chloroflexota bacterium]